MAQATLPQSITCNHCGHSWVTKSSRPYTTCPQCLYKVRIVDPSSNLAQTRRLDTKGLENWLWTAACSIRGAIDAPKFKDYILPLVFVKRLSDVFDDEVERLTEKFGDRKTAIELIERDHTLVRFFIPESCRWQRVRQITTRVGERLTEALLAIAKDNPTLQGVINVVDFNATVSGQRIVDDTRLQALLEVLSDARYRLGLEDVEPDILGRAYEYLLRKFAEDQGQSAGEFFTPKEVGWLMAFLVSPKQGLSVYDPACGSAGLLIKCQLALKEANHKIEIPLKLFGQELNHITYAMAKMNMIIHDMEGEIVIGDTLRNPKFLDGSSPRKFDIVVANPMWNQDGYGADFYENDPFGRFALGYPPSNSADWGWIQHMFSSLSETGRAAIILDTGAVSRGSGSNGGSKERKIRESFVRNDSLEGVILLPENLFYNTSSPGVILVMSRSKPAERKHKVILINAAGEFQKGKPKNFMTDEQIAKVAAAFHAGHAIDGFATVVSTEEIIANDCNMSPSRYVGAVSATDYIPLATAARELKQSKNARDEAERRVWQELERLGVGPRSE